MTPTCDKPLPECLVKLTLLDERQEALQRQQEGNSHKLDAIYSALLGDGEKPGIVTRVDRLEQCAARNVWWMRTIAGAVVAALVAWFWPAKK